MARPWHRYPADAGVGRTQPDNTRSPADRVSAGQRAIRLVEAGCPRWDSNPHCDPSKGSRSPAVIMPLTWSNSGYRIISTRTSARIWHTAGRSGLRPSGVNAALTPRRTAGQSTRPAAYSPSGSLVLAALLVAAGGSRGPQASRSDGVAALDAAAATWTMNGRGSKAVPTLSRSAGGRPWGAVSVPTCDTDPRSPPTNLAGRRRMRLRLRLGKIITASRVQLAGSGPPDLQSTAIRPLTCGGAAYPWSASVHSPSRGGVERAVAQGAVPRENQLSASIRVR